jgi:shikimate kinase
MNIVLIGYRGTGKTEISKVLEKKLGLTRISTDQEIVRKHGSIPKIVETKGWDAFRDIETEVVKEVSSKDNQIIDCGGGAILRKENRDALKKKGKVILLTAEVQTIAKRIKEDKNRPALKNGKTFIEEIEEVLNERKPEYNKAKDFEVKTDKISIKEAAQKIIELLGE